MVVVTGSDPSVIAALAEAIERAGRPVELRGLEDLDLASLLDARRSGGRLEVVVVDELSRLRGETSAHWRLARAIDVVAAAGASKLVLLTSRPPGDPHLVALRRSGVPYDILVAGRLREIDAAAVAAFLARPRIIVPAAVREACAGAISVADLIAATLASLDRQSAGRTIELGAGQDLVDELTHLGARPANGRWRSAWWRLLGRPALAVGSRGLVEIDEPPRLPPQAVASPHYPAL